jgi:hypothetical protein
MSHDETKIHDENLIMTRLTDINGKNTVSGISPNTIFATSSNITIFPGIYGDILYLSPKIAEIISEDPRILYYNKQMAYYEERLSSFPPPQIPKI